MQNAKHQPKREKRLPEQRKSWNSSFETTKCLSATIASKKNPPKQKRNEQKQKRMRKMQAEDVSAQCRFRFIISALPSEKCHHRVSEVPIQAQDVYAGRRFFIGCGENGR